MVTSLTLQGPRHSWDVPRDPVREGATRGGTGDVGEAGKSWLGVPRIDVEAMDPVCCACVRVLVCESVVVMGVRTLVSPLSRLGILALGAATSPLLL